jgi:hypothetical protein
VALRTKLNFFLIIFKLFSFHSVQLLPNALRNLPDDGRLSPTALLLALEPSDGIVSILDHVFIAAAIERFGNLRPSHALLAHDGQKLKVFFKSPFSLVKIRVEMVGPHLSAAFVIFEKSSRKGNEQLIGDDFPIELFGPFQQISNDAIETFSRFGCPLVSFPIGRKMIKDLVFESDDALAGKDVL